MFFSFATNKKIIRIFKEKISILIFLNRDFFFNGLDNPNQLLIKEEEFNDSNNLTGSENEPSF